MDKLIGNKVIPSYIITEAKISTLPPDCGNYAKVSHYDYNRNNSWPIGGEPVEMKFEEEVIPLHEYMSHDGQPFKMGVSKDVHDVMGVYLNAILSPKKLVCELEKDKILLQCENRALRRENRTLQGERGLIEQAKWWVRLKWFFTGVKID